MQINKSENTALAFTEGDCVLVVDMLQYKILHIMNPNDIEFCNSMLMNQEAVQVSSDGTLLILMVKKYLDVNRTDNIFSTVLWNITQGNYTTCTYIYNNGNIGCFLIRKLFLGLVNLLQVILKR